MKGKILLIFFLIPMFLFAQQDTLRLKLDSILREADLLYSYEKAAWIATDIFLQNKRLMKKFGNYLVYHIEDTICVAFIDKKAKYRLALYKFTFSNLDTPFSVNYNTTAPSDLEKRLFNIKNAIVSQIIDQKINILIPKGFSPNLELIPDQGQYRLYIIMGTNQTGVIPFGNDYVFIADTAGNILSWRKFHSRLIPTFTEGFGGNVTEVIHSHLRSTPYITATDICTFRLYAPIYGIKIFKVYSPALKMYFVYNLDKNSIEIEK